METSALRRVDLLRLLAATEKAVAADGRASLGGERDDRLRGLLLQAQRLGTLLEQVNDIKHHHIRSWQSTTPPPSPLPRPPRRPPHSRITGRGG